MFLANGMNSTYFTKYILSPEGNFAISTFSVMTIINICMVTFKIPIIP